MTRTSINDHQQHGVAATFSSEMFRGELMGILGNFQLRPDDFRERGYSGYLEWLATPKLAIGASSLITHRDLDTRLQRETWRHAHGVFARWATDWEPLVLLSEWDYVLVSPKEDEWREGVVGYLQADLEIVQGIHLIATGEAQNVGINTPPPRGAGGCRTRGSSLHTSICASMASTRASAATTGRIDGTFTVDPGPCLLVTGCVSVRERQRAAVRACLRSA